MSSDADLSTDDLARPGGMRESRGAGADDPSRGGGARGAGTGLGGDDPTVDIMDGAATERSTRGEVRATPGQGTESDAGLDMDAGPDMGPRQDDDAAVTRRSAPAAGQVGEGGDMALVDPAEGERLRQRWNDAQARFVDDPREAVQTADGLVAELMQSLASGFSQHKGRLESAWQSGDAPDTEELRQALQRYRSFFNRLLST
jgi:hypothetical protein